MTAHRPNRVIPRDASPELRQAIDALWDALSPLIDHDTIDLGGRRIVNAGRALDAGDVLTSADVLALRRALHHTRNEVRSLAADLGVATSGVGSGTDDGEDDPDGPNPGNQCPRTPPGAYETPVLNSIWQYVASAPAGVFEVNVTPPTLVNNTTAADAYRAGVCNLLETMGYGLNARLDPSDGKEIQVKAVTNPTFHEQYAIWVSDTLQIRQPPGAYRATCAPPDTF